MSVYLTVDGGTTNTRFRLAEKEGESFRVLSSLSLRVGAGNGADAVSAALREGVKTVLSEAGVPASSVTAAIASGMITSENGAYNLAHIPAPAGLKELHDAVVTVSLPDLPLPFSFIPGVRRLGGTLEETDMMRGEETELFGLIGNGGVPPRTLFVLPGSHSKLIRTDGEGRIDRFTTMLTGEMIASLSGNTILRSAVDLSVPCDGKSLVRGMEYAEKHGLNEALFKVRVMKNLRGADGGEALGFFLGAVLSGEIGAILSLGADSVVIAGRPQLRHAEAALLRAKGFENVREVSDEEAELAPTVGAIRVFEG